MADLAGTLIDLPAPSGSGVVSADAPLAGSVLSLGLNQDTVLPTISNMSHPPGIPVYTLDVVSFDLGDDRELRLIEIQVDQVRREVVHDGDEFIWPYLQSVRIELVPKKLYRFQIRRSGGWIVTPVWHLRVLDSNFNEPVAP